ncbi:hypothetical protein IGI04_020408 [Brassica rapa subsp. trilocularis]|uniref:BHLH domain-containing protein n=1 Tax=Brassica rapa subsp. trilocularis TaxID=1813537 RepID=A0ABQ7MM12_BRACM|nr:hypothetical protein IGI04_020408 [Brassica rapa subsp. trilocularis]
MEDVNQLFDAAFEFAHYPGPQGDSSVKEFLDRFPLPVIFNALQRETDIPGFETTLVTCLERVFKTKYGASLIPHYMPVLQAGLKSDSAVVKSLACKTVTRLLENRDANDVSPVQLIVSNGIYPLLLEYIIKSDDEVAHAASETIKSLASFPDATSVIFPTDTNDATHLGNLAARSSSLARVRVLSLIVKLFSISPHVASAVKNSGLLDLLEAEMKGTKDTLVILNVLELYYELMEVEHSSEFVPQTSLIQMFCSIISGTSVDLFLKLRAMMISGRLLSRDNIYNTVDEACVKALVSAIDASLESPEMNDTNAHEAALDALGQIGSTTKGANLVLSTTPPAARHVVASAFDRNALGKQLAALHALAYIAGETRPKSSRIVDERSEENLRCLIYDVAAQSTKLTPSGLFLSVLQQSSEMRLAGYRTLTALVARPWGLMEILSKEEIINIVTDATTETAKIAMEARYNCCKAIHEAFLCSNFVDDPRRLKTGEKLQEAVRSGPYMSKKYRDARPEVRRIERLGQEPLLFTSYGVGGEQRKVSMATIVQCLSSCAALNSKFKVLSLKGASSSSSSSPTSSSLSTRRGASATVCSSLSFSQSVSQCVAFSSGNLWVQKNPLRQLIVCEAAPTKKADSAAKRARQAEKRRVYNKSKKSEARTRMKKVLEALDGLKKKPDAQPDEIVTVEKLIGEAYSAIDKAVKVRALHKNTGARRKSRLARRKKAVEIHHGWYVPDTAAATTEAVTMAA